MTARRRPLLLPLLLLLVALPGTLPGAGADHISELSGMQTGLAAGHQVTVDFSFRPTGLCCTGYIGWFTGDGARATVDDGIYDGVYGGDATGSGIMTDYRPFTWTRTMDVTGKVHVAVTYRYVQGGVYLVEFDGCCPRQYGNTTVVAF